MAALFKPCVSGLLCRKFIKQGCRMLFGPRALKTDQYEKMRAQEIADSKKVDVMFRDRMKQNISSDKYTIFNSDVLKMTYIIQKNDEDDKKLFVEMLKKAKSVNTFTGNIIMSMLHYLEEPELALKLIKTPEYSRLLARNHCYFILMDLLVKKHKYQLVLDVFNDSHHAHNPKIPLLALASCYKLNTRESFEFAKELVKDIKMTKREFLLRSMHFACALAIKQNDPKFALEFLSLIDEDEFFITSNLKMMALSDIGHLDDVFYELGGILRQNVYERTSFRKQLYPDCLRKIEFAVERVGSGKSVELMKIVNKLNFKNKICKQTVEDELFKEINEIVKPVSVLSRGINVRGKVKDINVFEEDGKVIKYRKGLFHRDR